MTRYVVPAAAALHLAAGEAAVEAGHQLLGPTLLRSQTLSLLHEAVQRGELPAATARTQLARVGKLPIRLLATASCAAAPGTSPSGSAGRPRTTPSTWP